MNGDVRKRWQVPFSMLWRSNIFLALCTIILSCEDGNLSTIYVPGREWIFIVKSSPNQNVDTLTLSVLDEEWSLNQCKIQWILSTCKAEGSTVVTETTGVLDRSSSVFFPKEIWLHPPRMSYLRLTELVAFPQVIFPLKENQVFSSEIRPGDGWKELQGLTVHGCTRVAGKVSFLHPCILDSCWKLEASGSSEKGDYNAIYYYHSLIGFVYFHYDFGDYMCDIELVSVNF